MKADFTDITLVIDRSGSMSNCRSDAEGGINEFVDRQKLEPGSAALTLVQFDDTYEVVLRSVPIRQSPKISLIPRGMTALLDAVGKSLVETGERLKAMREEDRPGLVVFVILTDGLENSSKEFTKSKVKEMIEHQQNVYRWQFIFLGANQDAFAEAAGMGINQAGVANYVKTSGGLIGAAANVSRMRATSRAGADVKNFYTDEDLAGMK